MWRRRWRREGGGHQPRDGRPEPLAQGWMPRATSPGMDARSPQKLEEVGKEPLDSAQPWDTLTSDVWSPGLGEDGCFWFEVTGL